MIGFLVVMGILIYFTWSIPQALDPVTGTITRYFFPVVLLISLYGMLKNGASFELNLHPSGFTSTRQGRTQSHRWSDVTKVEFSIITFNDPRWWIGQIQQIHLVIDVSDFRTKRQERLWFLLKDINVSPQVVFNTLKSYPEVAPLIQTNAA